MTARLARMLIDMGEWMFEHWVRRGEQPNGKDDEMTEYRDGKTAEQIIRETGTPRDLISHLLYEIAQKAEWLAWQATRARKVVDALEPEPDVPGSAGLGLAIEAARGNIATATRFLDFVEKDLRKLEGIEENTTPQLRAWEWIHSAEETGVTRSDLLHALQSDEPQTANHGG